MTRLIALYTDFGIGSHYVGQVHAVLAAARPGVPVVDLCHDAPCWDPRRAAYLLPALVPVLPARALVMAVVDPGVGGERAGLILRQGERLLVGPDNGLFELLLRRGGEAAVWRITQPPRPAPSRTFDGRDLFAPVVAALAGGVAPDRLGVPHAPRRQPDWPDDLAEIIHVDPYGNLATGLRAERLDPGRRLRAAGLSIAHAPTFAAVPRGQPFWHANANGLVEIAVNQGRADRLPGLAPGVPVVPE